MSSYSDAAAQRRRRMTIMVAGGILFAMIVALSLAATAGLSHSKSGPSKKTANGLVSIANKADYVLVSGDPSASLSPAAQECRGTGNFTDVSRGGTVTISDFNGKVLATTNLGTGSVDANGFCVFPFTAPVPTGKGPYGVQITRRKAVQVDENDLFTLVTLTLGV